MGSLRRAREEDRLDEFIAEREKAASADHDRFFAVLKSMIRTSKSEPETSPPDCDDD